MTGTLVLGLGNILCGDEGIGCRVAEYLYAVRDFPEDVRIADGGTIGQELLDPVMEADKLLLIDCGDFGLQGGETLVRNNRDVPIWLGIAKMSPHQGSFAEILALAELKNRLPKKLALLAIQPLQLEYGEKLSPDLKANLELYAKKAEEILAAWGIRGRKRDKLVYLTETPVALQNFETGVFPDDGATV